MKRKKMLDRIACLVNILVALPVFGLIGCGAAGETCPEWVKLTIHDRRASGITCESARTPVVRTALRGDTLDVDFRMEFQEKGKFDFDIPERARKIRLFGCEYDLPSAEHTAFFRAVLMEEIRPSWPRREEVQYAQMLLCLAPDRKNFDVQIRYLGYSGEERWKWREHDFSCLVAADGQIVELLNPEEQRRMEPGTQYLLSPNFTNQDGKLQIRLETTGRYYKYLRKKEIILEDIVLPEPDPRPYTVFFLNMPLKEKYLEENRSADLFKVRKSVAEFRTFAEKLKRLRCGMTQEETAVILGKPDDYCKSGRKGPNTKSNGFARYDFLSTETAGSSNAKDLTVTLLFEEAPDGVLRLQEVY